MTNDPDKNMKALLSACKTLAVEEGIVDEEDLITRTNDIYKDARLPNPLTEVGKKAQAKAIEMIEANEIAASKGVHSPYMENKFDYVAQFNTMVPPSIADILKLFPTYADALTIPSKASPLSADEQTSFDDAIDKMSLDCFAIFKKYGVPMTKYSNLFSELRDIISAVERMCNDQIAGHSAELLARSYGAVNPGNDLFDVNYATYQDLIDAREKIKKETDGPNGEDKYSVKDSSQEGGI